MDSKKICKIGLSLTVFVLFGVVGISRVQAKSVGLEYQDQTHIVQKREKNYTVNFDSNGGEGVFASVRTDKLEFFVKKGIVDTLDVFGTITLPKEKPIREGYTFIGWNTKADGTGFLGKTGQKMRINKSCTLYACWIKHQVCEVNFNINGDKKSSIVMKTDKNSSFILPKAPYMTGCAFVEWNTEADGSGYSGKVGEKVYINKNCTLYAQWENYSDDQNETDLSKSTTLEDIKPEDLGVFDTLQKAINAIRGEIAFSKGRNRLLTVTICAGQDLTNIPSNEIVYYIYNELVNLNSTFKRDQDYIIAVASFLSESGVCCGFCFEYLVKEKQKKEIDFEISSILKELELNGKSDFKKVRSIYNFVVTNVDYLTRKPTLYDAAILGRANCVGCSALFRRLCREAGLCAEIVLGEIKDGEKQGKHAWNIVKIGNLFFNIDTTHEDDSELNFAYFLKSDNDTYFKNRSKINQFNSRFYTKSHPISEVNYPIVEYWENCTKFLFRYTTAILHKFQSEGPKLNNGSEKMKTLQNAINNIKTIVNVKFDQLRKEMQVLSAQDEQRKSLNEYFKNINSLLFAFETVMNQKNY